MHQSESRSQSGKRGKTRHVSLCRAIRGARRTAREAGGDLLWVELVVVWGSTELAHKVSNLYTGSGDRRVVTCGRRGVAALGETLVFAAKRGQSRRDA